MICCKFEPTLEWCKKYGQDLLYVLSDNATVWYSELDDYDLENDLTIDDKKGIIEIIQPKTIWQEADGRYIEPVEEMTPEQIYKELGRKIKIVMGGGSY